MSSGLKRDLGLLGATTLIIGSMIGSGIFLTPGGIARQVGDGYLVLLVWLAGGLLSLLGAFTYAELGAMFPQSGGQYVYMRETYGKFLAYLNGWNIFAIGKSASVAALALGFALTLKAFPFAAGWSAFLIALTLIVALTAVNVVGVRYGGYIGNASTFVKLGAVGGITLVGVLYAARGGDVNFATGAASASAPTGWALLSAFGAAVVTSLFAYDGWVNSTQVAEEIKNPERNVPRSLILGTLIVTAAYVLINVAYLSALGFDGLVGSAGAKDAAASTVATLTGSTGRVLVAVAILVSVFGTVNAVILSGPRILFAMARDRVVPGGIAKVHPAWGTPVRSILIQSLISVGFVILAGFRPDGFDFLTNTIIITSYVFFAFGALAVILHRRRSPDRPR
ncbi:MAG TPA: amino acid permease, partial [Candidatus Thermoplasmatota archaeon]|nr:amino acid permease [Candidatus Thermoplasmatota archaeon]